MYMSVAIKLIVHSAFSIAITAFFVLTAHLPNKRPNGFKRFFLYTETISPNTSIETDADVRQIISLTEDHIYLSTSTPGEILVIDHQLKTARTITFPFPDSLRNTIGNVFSTQLDSPHVYLFAGNMSAIVCSSIRQEANIRVITVPGPAFLYAVALSKNSFVLQQFQNGVKDKQFVKFNSASHTTHPEDSISLQSEDGGVSTDGQLHYDQAGNRLLYMHYYNNTILTFDTNLVLKTRFHTIDTISSRHSLEARAPLVSNQKSCLYNNLLLVCSNLKADNEKHQKYRNNIPIDIYKIATGQYIGSVYIPVSQGKLVKSMRAYGNKLAALYHNNHLSLFTLPFGSEND